MPLTVANALDRMGMEPSRQGLLTPSHLWVHDLYGYMEKQQWGLHAHA